MSTITARQDTTLSRLVRRVPMLGPIELRDFRLLWAGEGVSLLGDQFHFVALATLVFALTGSGLALGTVLVAAAIPRAALMVFGGALTDRFSPRTLMFGSNVLRSVVVATVAILVLSGRAELWHLVVLAVIFGAVDALFFPALNTIIPMLVPAAHLPAANGLVQVTSQFMHLIGPALAGVVVAAVGTGSAFAFDAVSFGLAALALLAIQGGRRPARPAITEDGTPAAPSLLASIREGAAYAFRDPGIRAVILLAAAINLATSGPIAVGVAWLANVRFEGGPVLFGLMFAGYGAGAVIGAIVAGSTARPRRFGRLILGLAMVFAVQLAALGLAPNGLIATAGLVLAGLASGYLNVAVISWLQVRSDPVLLGRVMSLVMLGAVGLQPVSFAIAGVLVDAYATPMYLLAGGLIVAAVAAALIGGSTATLDGKE
jgi:Transmembrane secretion effector